MDDVRDPKVLNWKELQAIPFTYDSPFILEFGDNQFFTAEKVVRVIPKRRMVAFGTWLGKSVVAKIFFDAKHAKRHVKKDLAGIKTLRENKIPTPPLYFKGISKDKRVYVLLYQQIFESKNLEEIWLNKTSVDELLPLLKAVVIELATQHVLGVLQHDLHLGNFLISKKRIYTLDGAQIQLFPQLLGKQESVDSLALFLSQFGVGYESYQEILFKHYAKARGWRLKDNDTVELFLQIKKWNALRWQKFEKKIFRESTQFAHINDWQRFGMYDRDYATPEFMQLLSQPEIAFTHPTAKILKAGRSSSVVKITLGQREFVIKRYNLKSFWHRVRRSLRPTRAFQCWRLAHKLNLFGVATAKPVAFIEKRYLGLRGKSYYITEYIPGEHIGEFFAHANMQTQSTINMAKQITSLLKNMAKLEVTHGDLKKTNILISKKEQPTFIDLDGAAEHASLSSLRSAWRKEITRFLDNFRDQPSVLQQFKLELNEK